MARRGLFTDEGWLAGPRIIEHAIYRLDWAPRRLATSIPTRRVAPWSCRATPPRVGRARRSGSLQPARVAALDGATGVLPDSVAQTTAQRGGPAHPHRALS